MAIEIVDLPNFKMVIFQFAMWNYQRVIYIIITPFIMVMVFHMEW